MNRTRLKVCEDTVATVTIAVSEWTKMSQYFEYICKPIGEKEPHGIAYASRYV